MHIKAIWAGISPVGAYSGNVYSDPNTGNVGIGTTTPYANLSIHANNGDINRILFAIASSTSNATTSLFTISNTGVVNAGTTATSTFLGPVRASCFTPDGVVCLTGAGGGGGITSITAGSGLTGGTITTSGTIALDLTNPNSWTGLQQFANASTSILSVSGNSPFGGSALTIITANGSLGVGTTSPTAPVTIQNNYGSNTNTLFLIASSTSPSGSTASTLVKVTNTGTLGIGLASPSSSYSLDAGGSIHAGGNTIIRLRAPAW